MDVDRVQPGAKHTAGHTPVVQTLNAGNCRYVELPDAFALCQVLAPFDVFAHHQPDVGLVALMVVEGEPG